MTNNQLTRERLEKIKSWRDTYGAGSNVMLPAEEAEELSRMALAAMDSEPVAYTDERNLGYIDRGRETAYLWGKQNSEASDVALHRHAQQSVVPEEMNFSAACNFVQINGMAKEDRVTLAMRVWNACRAAMLQDADGKPELTVWYGAMPETNGKTNWTAILHREGQHPWEGITIDLSEYPDRVRYEADRMRHLIGELADEPDILAYDAEAHSGYVYPGNSPVIPEGYVMVPKELTCEMDDAAWEAYHNTRCMSDIWDALLSCTPQEPKP